MKKYCISYDLRKDRNYEELYKTIRAYRTYAHALESTWFVITNESAKEIRDKLMKIIDKDDGLIVIELGEDWGSYGLGQNINDWLKKNI